MTQLRPFDILVIQTAIEEYKRKHPRRPTPSAEVALAWRLGRRGRRKHWVPAKLEGEMGLLRWIYESFRARLLLL
jgi:hypothetical protein